MNINNSLFLDILACEGAINYLRGWEDRNPAYSIELDSKKEIKVYVTDNWWNPLITVQVLIDGRFKTQIVNLSKKQARAVRKHCKMLHDERAKVNKAMWAKYHAEQAAKPTAIDLFLKEHYSDRTVSNEKVGNNSELPIAQ